MSAAHVPAGYHSVTPYLIAKDATKAIEFYQKAFGAKEVMRLTMPGGKIGHAEMEIGDSRIMLADEFPDMGAISPLSCGGTPVSFLLYVPDADAAVAKAVAAGATIKRPIQDQFYGDRSGVIVDPSGHNWSIATRKENMSNEEMQRRFEAAMQQQSG